MNLQHQYGEPTHIILHLSDMQLTPETNNWNGYPLNADNKFRNSINSIIKSGIKADTVIFTGDLTDKGDPECYKTIQKLVEPLKKFVTDNIIWVMGNHDTREPFKEHLMNETPTNTPADYTVNVNELQIIVLDTTVPNHHYGNLTPTQLNWLDTQLQTPTKHGTIIALHHPPMPLNLPLAATVELQNQNKLHEITKKYSHIRSIIGGHVHYSAFSMFGTIPVSVASSTCYTQDLTSPTGGARGQDFGQSYNLIKLYENTIMHTVVPIGNHTPIGETITPETVQQKIEQHNIKPYRNNG